MSDPKSDLKRQRPTVRRIRMLEQALDLMVEAHDLERQAFRASGLVSPESPGGQLTAIRYDGTPVDRTRFSEMALQCARSVLAGGEPALLMAKLSPTRAPDPHGWVVIRQRTGGPYHVGCDLADALQSSGGDGDPREEWLHCWLPRAAGATESKVREYAASSSAMQRLLQPIPPHDLERAVAECARRTSRARGPSVRTDD